MQVNSLFIVVYILKRNTLDIIIGICISKYLYVCIYAKCFFDQTNKHVKTCPSLQTEMRFRVPDEAPSSVPWTSAFAGPACSPATEKELEAVLCDRSGAFPIRCSFQSVTPFKSIQIRRLDSKIKMERDREGNSSGNLKT